MRPFIDCQGVLYDLSLTWFYIRFYQDFATFVKDCSEIKTENGKIDIWSVREACKYKMMGWLKEDASINDEVKTKYDALDGASENIAKCLQPKSKKKVGFEH